MFVCAAQKPSIHQVKKRKRADSYEVMAFRSRITSTSREMNKRKALAIAC